MGSPPDPGYISVLDLALHGFGVPSFVEPVGGPHGRSCSRAGRRSSRSSSSSTASAGSARRCTGSHPSKFRPGPGPGPASRRCAAVGARPGRAVTEQAAPTRAGGAAYLGGDGHGPAGQRHGALPGRAFRARRRAHPRAPRRSGCPWRSRPGPLWDRHGRHRLLGQDQDGERGHAVRPCRRRCTSPSGPPPAAPPRPSTSCTPATRPRTGRRPRPARRPLRVRRERRRGSSTPTA